MSNPFTDGYPKYNTANGFGNPHKWRSSFRKRMTQEEANTIIEAVEQSPYELLGLEPNATQEMIKKAFRQLIKEWHPDCNPHRPEEAKQKSQQLIAAYLLLSQR